MKPTHNHLKAAQLPQSNYRIDDALLEHYVGAGPDYRYWSKNFNMHFGYYRWPMNLFDREAMLEEMNLQVLKRLNVPLNEAATILDIGCGLTATTRTAARHYPRASFKAMSIVPWQLEEAEKINQAAGLAERIKLYGADFREMPLEDQSIDFAYAIESSCYGAGESKADLLSEIYRVLKPGGRFVIADVFKKHRKPLRPIVSRAYQEMCRIWALPALASRDSFHLEAAGLGFEQINMEEISKNVAPCAFHVPFTIVGYLIREMRRNRSLKLKQASWDHLKASACAVVLGLALKDFGYYMVSGQKAIVL